MHVCKFIDITLMNQETDFLNLIMDNMFIEVIIMTCN